MIVRTIQSNPVVVIAGETGSGKTTQLPKFLLECGFGQRGWIGCTQPRRVAAMSVAKRIAEELQVPLGQAVGAKIRFTDQTSTQTAVKLMTDGILLNEIQEDPQLSRYEAIVIDEAHERSLNIDFILGHLRGLMRQRPELKIVITSATIDTETFSKAFNDAPIIEVSGRTFPVETLYRPLDPEKENNGSTPYIEAAAELIHEIIANNQAGDILSFLPSERDIHELRKLLDGSLTHRCDVLPLYGRLATADQQRIFSTAPTQRRIILATNIAETSLTVPGIRYVIDTGLARVSRYSPHSRTQRLPIEPIAQSSANQRQGRCGRVSDGVCYRLYSEEDYHSRPRFTTPEIHRANLAAVILRMMAFRLGDIRQFPFIEPPAENAIRGGQRLLAELGAIQNDSEQNDQYRLTRLGHKLAQLPVDPTVARMLLYAAQVNALPEVLVIAAGLSIQDPRERPSELSKEADAMQQRFIHKESDFLTLLNIWNSYHGEMERLSQGQLRKFCKQHFLSYQRMREWREVHQQLAQILKDRKKTRAHRACPQEQGSARKGGRNADAELAASYAAIHQSILAGLLSNIAFKDREHQYHGPRGRSAMLFPGSGLFDHEAAKKQRKLNYAKPSQKPKPAKTKAPNWIVCGEWMETGRLYARTAAKIEVQWIEQVAGPLLQIKHSESFLSTRHAAAQCKQRTLLFGLELKRRNVSLSPIDPDTATDLFVRNGLIEAGIHEQPAFLQHNKGICELAESELARKRLGSGQIVEDRLFDFYRSRLDAVGSYAELRGFAKASQGGSLDFLKVSLTDLLPEAEASDDDTAFPASVTIGGSTLPLLYRHDPGGAQDGVTLRVPLQQLEALQLGQLDWAVPGHLQAKVESLLRGLPKAIRVQLHPLKERSIQIAQQLKQSQRPLHETLAEYLKSEYKILTRHQDWSAAAIPDYLQPCIQVEDTKGQALATSRDLQALRRQLNERHAQNSKGHGIESLPAWQAAAQHYERECLSTWDFGDLPESIDLAGEAGLPLKAYPALTEANGQVHLRLLPRQKEAHEATRKAWPLLGESSMGRDLAWIRRDLKELKQLGLLLLPLGPLETIQEAAWGQLRRHLFRSTAMHPLKAAEFTAVLKRAATERRGIVQQFKDRLNALLEARLEVSKLLEVKQTKQAITYPGMRAHLEQIAPSDLLDRYEYVDLAQLTRFLQAMLQRAQRAKANIQRDIEKSKRVAPYEQRLQELRTLAADDPQVIQPYHMLLEEFKVSVYAQELGTAQKVSEKRLDQLAESIEQQFKGC